MGGVRVGGGAAGGEGLGKKSFRRQLIVLLIVNFQSFSNNELSKVMSVSFKELW